MDYVCSLWLCFGFFRLLALKCLVLTQAWMVRSFKILLNYWFFFSVLLTPKLGTVINFRMAQWSQFWQVLLSNFLSAWSSIIGWCGVCTRVLISDKWGDQKNLAPLPWQSRSWKDTCLSSEIVLEWQAQGEKRIT